MNKITLALVITKPGHLRNSLQSLLRTIPQIEIIAEAQDISVLLKMSEAGHPELIFIDACIIDDVNWAAIKKLNTEWPRTKILVFTENEKQTIGAKEAGADFVLPKGFPASDLVHLIENSLFQNLQDDTPQEKSNY